MSSPAPNPGPQATTGYLVTEGAVLYGRVDHNAGPATERPATQVVALHSMKPAVLAEVLADFPPAELALMRARLSRALWAVEEAMDTQGAFTRTITQEPA